MRFPNNITRRPIFWIFFALASVISFLISLKSPYITFGIKVTMDKEQALKTAKIIATKFHLVPKKYAQTVYFSSFESTLKEPSIEAKSAIFVCLECGGRQALTNMIKQRLYIPDVWKVRHFKELDKNETLIKFTYDGKPYGFKETLSDQKQGAIITINQAQKIAESQASKNWNINLDEYKFIESYNNFDKSSIKKYSYEKNIENQSIKIEIEAGQKRYSQAKPIIKRTDYTFIYEKKNKKIGSGTYRLKITVSGNKVSQLEHFINIPKEFDEKFSYIKMENKAIGTLFSILYLLLYLFGGFIVWAFLLRPKRYAIWKAPFIVGSVLALLNLISDINNLPIIWKDYNTAESFAKFLSVYLLKAYILFFGNIILFTFSFMLAESLTRKAFGNHIQFWKIFSKNNINSKSVFGRILGGYLIWPIDLLTMLSTIFICENFLGWAPMYGGTALNLNILLSYFPWISIISISLTAGLFEECLLRAVPIAFAAIIGKKYGHKKLFIGIALIIQAIIFGGMHTFTITQPAYAHVLYFFIQSIILGLIYIKFGLLPVILSHFVYDAILLSLLPTVTLANQIIVIAIVLIPLWLSFLARLRYGKWTEIKEDALNRAWVGK